MTARRGLSLIGLLVSIVCVVVLLSVMLPALRTATTGLSDSGGQSTASAWAAADKVNLYAIGQSMLAGGLGVGMDSMWASPAASTGRRDVSENTTANLYSLLIMDQRVQPSHLISRGDRGLVEIDDDYDFTAYDPRSGVYWDPSFTADLSRMSNTSWAHMPLQGARYDNHWRNSMSGSFPLFGSRGPEDGVLDPDSVTCHNGQWTGSIWSADGSVRSLESIGSWNASINGGEDNLFRVDDPRRGADAVLGFTRSIDEDGVTLQWD